MPEEVSPQRDNAVTKPLESFAASYAQNSLGQSIPVAFRTPNLAPFLMTGRVGRQLGPDSAVGAFFFVGRHIHES
jgi:hypothetical protein